MKSFKELQENVDSIIEDAKPVNDVSKTGKKLVSAFDVINHANKIAKEEGSYHDARKTKLKVTREHLQRARSELLGESEQLDEYLDKERMGDYELHNRSSVVSNKKYKVKHRATGKVVSIHNNSLDAVRSAQKLKGSLDTHVIVRESVVSVHKDKEGHVLDAQTVPDSEGKHRIQVTVSDPNHTSVSMRKEKKQKFIKIPGAHSKDSALDTAKKYYKKQGYKVHSAEHVGMVKESEDLIEGKIQDINTKLAQHAQRKIDHEQKYGQMNGADLHSHEVIRKQLLDKKKRLVASKMRSESTELEEESEQLDELSIDTLKTYSAKAKEDSNKLVNQGAKAKKVETSYSKFKKATKRLDGASAADKKVFKKEWNSKVGISEELDMNNAEAVPYKELVKKFQKPQDKEVTNLPHGHTMNPTSDENRHQLIKKARGE